MNVRLTQRQKDVLDYVRRQVDQGVSPTIREIAEYFGFASHTSSEKHLFALEKKGLIRRRKGSARAIELICDKYTQEENVHTSKIPIIGDIAAGGPILAQENFQGFLSLDECFGNSDNLFALKVKGDSMVNAGIDNGDLVIVRLQNMVANGDIAVIYSGEYCEATIKRFFLESSRIKLQPENESYKPIFFSRNDSEFRIGGKVIGVIKRF
jgi:repressor LexA